MSVVKSDFKVGDRVSHSKLGEGDILDLYPYGEDTVAVISFEKWGQKKIVLRYAKLTIVIPPPEEEKEEEEKKPRKTAKAKKKAKKTTKKTAKKAAKKTAKKAVKKAKKKAKKK
jgi:hypothetical protein